MPTLPVLLAGLTLALALVPASSTAEERSPRVLLNPGALICDTQVQLLEFIAHQAMEHVPGCGRTNRPLWVEIEPLDELIAHDRRFELIVYHFPMMTAQGEQMWVQYGYWGTPEYVVPGEPT